MPAPFGSSARRLQGDVLGSAERAKRPHSAASEGFQPSRKSFFQSLDAAERAALLKVAPSLRATFQTPPARERGDLDVDDDDFDRVVPDTKTTKTTETQTPVTKMKSTASSPPSGADSPTGVGSPPAEIPCTVSPPKPRRPPRASSSGPTRRPAAPTPIQTAPPPRASPRAGSLGSLGSPGASPGTSSGPSPRDVPRDVSGRTCAPRVEKERAQLGFDRELTRDFAKRESALRFEVERWRARAEALAEENESVRVSVETARRRNADAEGTFASQSRELDRLRERAVGEGAARAARLEERCERQRRALRELAVASEALAKDNVLLSSELVALRDRGDDAEAQAATLAERLDSARRLYLANQKSFARAEETRGVLPDGRWEKKLNQLLTADVLAKSKPPPAYPMDRARGPLGELSGLSVSGNDGTGSGKCVPGALVQERRRLHDENASLRKELNKARAEIVSLREKRLLTNAELASARREWGSKTRVSQARLAGAARRLRWLVERVEKLEGSAAEKDAYAASLERRLLAQHETLGKMTKSVAAELREKRERALRNVSRRSSASPESAGGHGKAASKSLESNAALASAVSFLKSGSGSGSSKKKIAARSDGWVPGNENRTPTARDALRFARRARVRTSSPTGENALDETSLDSQTESDDESRGEAAGTRAAVLEFDAAARRVDFGYGGDPHSTPGAKELANSRVPSAPASPGTAPGTPGEEGVGVESNEDFSMDGIEAYISNLHALHRKSELAVKTPRGKGR